MPPKGAKEGTSILGLRVMRYHDRASLIASWYGVPPIHRSPRCAWGLGRGRDAGLPHKTLLPPPNAGTAEPFRVSPPEAVAYQLELFLTEKCSSYYPPFLAIANPRGND